MFAHRRNSYRKSARILSSFWQKSEKLLKVRYGTKFMGENYRKLKFCRK